MAYAAGPVLMEDYRIPESLVGLVIGRGGEQIKRLQSDSGCKIRIARDSDGTQERTCTITGSQLCIDEAKRMLGEIVQRGLNRDQNGGGGGGGGGFQPRQQYGGGGGGGGGYHQGGGYNNNYQRGGYGGGGYNNNRFQQQQQE